MTGKIETGEKIKVLIVDDIKQTRTDIRRLLYFEEDMEVCGEAQNGREALAIVDKCCPDVVLMDINMPVLDGIGATEALTRSNPHISVVIISIQGEQEYLRKAMLAGARDYLVKPLGSEDMASTIRQVYRTAQQREQRVGMGQGAVRTQEIHPANPFKVITLFGGKGGSGKSFLAANLAVAMAKRKMKTALVDLDLQFGDIGVMFNLGGTGTIADLTGDEEDGGINSRLLEELLMRHLSGVAVLTAPPSPPEAEKIHTGHVEQIIAGLKESFDCIILDTSSFFGDITLLALEKSDLILLPVRRDIATIKNARSGLDVLNTLQLGDKVRVVLNQSTLDPGIELSDLEQSLGNKICHSVAGDEKGVIASINRGVPLVMEQNNNDVSRDICQLAEKICNGFAEKEQAAARKMSLGKIFSLSFG